MKKLVLAAALIAAAASVGSSPAAAEQVKKSKVAREGTEVGTGIPDVTEQLPRYHANKDADLYAYCADALSALIRKIRFSTRPNNGFAKKRQLVIEGLRDALRSYERWPQDFNPLTRQALQRGLRFNEVFDMGCQTENCRNTENRRAYNYLLIYSNLVINKIAPLDQFYYIPWKLDEDCYFFDNCSTEVWFDSFMDYYKDAAVALLEMYAGVDGDRTGLPNAFASDFYELRSAALIFQWAAEDLNSSDFRRSMSCTYQDLRQTAVDIRDFLNNEDPGFGSSPEAVRVARGVAMDALAHLKTTNCRPPREVYPRRYDERKRSSQRYELPSLIYRRQD